MAEVLLNFKVSTLCETLVSVADPLIHPKIVSSILKLVEFGPELVDRESIRGMPFISRYFVLVADCPRDVMCARDFFVDSWAARWRDDCGALGNQRPEPA